MNKTQIIKKYDGSYESVRKLAIKNNIEAYRIAWIVNHNNIKEYMRDWRKKNRKKVVLKIRKKYFRLKKLASKKHK